MRKSPVHRFNWIEKRTFIVFKPQNTISTFMADSATLKKYKTVDDPKLIMTILVKDEVDVIEHNLLFHKNQEVDAFIVTDNNSTDGTREILRKYKDKGWILDLIDEPSDDYQQKEWVHRMIMKAKDYTPDWIINSDADEFWVSRTGNLKDEIRNFDGNKVYVPSWCMRDRGEADFFENNEQIVRLFSRYYRYFLILSGKLCRYSQLTFGIPKVMHRMEDYQMIHMGNHWVSMNQLAHERNANQVYINHYNVRGAKQFKQKMILGAEACERNLKLGKNAAQHWKYFLGRYRRGISMDIEYERMVGNLCLKDIEKYRLCDIDNTVRDFFRAMQNES